MIQNQLVIILELIFLNPKQLKAILKIILRALLDQFLALQTLKLVKMKINAEQFLSNGGFKNDKNKLFYISGNEETMIQKVQDLVISELKRIGYENIVKSNDVEIKTTDIKQVGGDLFGGSKILVYENPKKIDLEDLANIDQKKTAIIIKETKNSKQVLVIELFIH